MAERQQPSDAKTLKQLFDAEPDRLSRLIVRRRRHLFRLVEDPPRPSDFDQFVERARADGLRRGARRAVRRRNRQPERGQAGDPRRRARQRRARRGRSRDRRRQRMRALVDAIEGGAFGRRPESCTSASAARCSGRRCWSMRLAAASSALTVRFLSNIDGAAFDEAVKPLDPGDDAGRCRVQDLLDLETLTNLEAARAWLRGGGRRRPRRPSDRGNRQARSGARAGDRREPNPPVRRRRRRPLFAVELGRAVSAALALGWDAFEALLEGAAEMDRHFRFAEPARMCR